MEKIPNCLLKFMCDKKKITTATDNSNSAYCFRKQITCFSRLIAPFLCMLFFVSYLKNKIDGADTCWKLSISWEEKNEHGIVHNSFFLPIVNANAIVRFISNITKIREMNISSRQKDTHTKKRSVLKQCN